MSKIIIVYFVSVELEPGGKHSTRVLYRMTKFFKITFPASILALNTDFMKGGTKSIMYLLR